MRSTIINNNYVSVSYEYYDNPNPIVRCGHILSYDHRLDYYQYNQGRFTLLDLLNEVYGEFYHIDPLSIFTVEHPAVRGIQIGFKAKSRIKPYKEELEDWKTECLNYWIENL